VAIHIAMCGCAWALCLPAPTAAAAAQVQIGVVLSNTGGARLASEPERKTLELLPRKVGELDIQYRVLDDGSDHNRTHRQVAALAADGVDAVIGPASRATAVLAGQAAAEVNLPFIAQADTAEVVEPVDDRRRWAFKTRPNEAVVADAIVADLVRRHVKTFGIIGINEFFDDLGNRWNRAFLTRIPLAGLTFVDYESAYRDSADVEPLAARIHEVAPEAVLVAVPPKAALRVQQALRSHGYRGLIYHLPSAATEEFAAAAHDGALIAASPVQIADQLPDSDPVKAVAQRYAAACRNQLGEPVTIQGAALFDAGLLLQQAIAMAATSARPGTPQFRSALRDALESLHDVPGANGVYSMSPRDHAGLGQPAIVMIALQGGHWQRLAAP
jgi:branched-chain amino acid transport system substrate-binding protein